VRLRTQRTPMSQARYDDPDLLLCDLMERWPETIPVFIRHKMLCVGCVITRYHTLADACQEYGLDKAEFLAEIGRAISPEQELR